LKGLTFVVCLYGNEGLFGEPVFFGHFKNCFKEERVMVNKNLVLGGLAGATLLLGAAFMTPTVADAAMNGTCVDCHTMHNSDDGGTMAPGKAVGDPGYAQLLRFDGCVGCHAIAAQSNVTTTGKPSTAPKAPQVDNTGTTMLAGGFFATGVNDGPNNHTVGAAVNAAAVALTDAPGNGVGNTFNPGANGSAFNCEDCHASAVGGHHSYTGAGSAKAGTLTTNSFRMLQADSLNDGTADGNFVTSGSAPNAIWGVNDTYATTNYNAASMNAYCAECHADFHGAGNTQDATSGAWVRHPTNVNANTYGLHVGGATAQVPTGETDNDVMCISCHRAHGSAFADTLRFTYSSQNANDGVASVGCESCHGSK
jgi:hypothetical protein